MPIRLSLTLLACASALALSACKDDSPPTPAAYDFASAPPATVEVNAPAQYGGYALAERAHAFDRATYRSAPSYGFRYGEEEPWAWRTADDYSMYAEPYDDGYRSYYYEPGADYPYFVRDGDYGYGYGPDGRLIAAYDASGALLPQDRLYALARLAGTYLVRASAIRRYALDDRYRMPVTEGYWTERAPRYYQTRELWYGAPERQPEWREWRASHEREAARFVPRGDVRRWSKADDRAWRAYEQADRKAWQAEDKAWRKADRQGDGHEDRVAFAPQPAPAARAIHEARRDRGDNRRIGRRDEAPVQRAAIEAPRDPERHGNEPPRPDRVRLATAEPPRGSDASARERLARPAEPPRAAPREHRGGQDRPRPQEVAKAEPPRAQAAPPREHGENRRAEARQQAAAAGPPRPGADRHAGGGGKPDRPTAAPAQAQPHAKGGGKPDKAEKDGGKDRS